MSQRGPRDAYEAGAASAGSRRPVHRSHGSARRFEDPRVAPKLIGRRGVCEWLDQLVGDVLGGTSRVSVLRGEAGVGKSALLDYLAQGVPDWRMVKAAGVESEMELAYSGLHQLCTPALDHLDRLPAPQRTALATVFGRSSGPAPDRFWWGSPR